MKPYHLSLAGTLKRWRLCSWVDSWAENVDRVLEALQEQKRKGRDGKTNMNDENSDGSNNEENKNKSRRPAKLLVVEGVSRGAGKVAHVAVQCAVLHSGAVMK